MKKKHISIILALVMVLSFASCGETKETSDETKETAKQEETAKEIGMKDGTGNWLGDRINLSFGDQFHIFPVLTDGKSTSSFTITVDNSDVDIKKVGSAIRISHAKSGITLLTIEDRGATASYYVVVDSNPEEVEILEPDLIVDRIEFSELLQQINSEHEDKILAEGSFDGFEQYLKHYKGEVDITKSEVESLLESGSLKSTVTYEEAKADVDLYFRALKYGYGGYYYFGESNFKTAEEAVLESISGKETVKVYELQKALQQSLLFVRDGHFSIGKHYVVDDSSVRYEFYYSDVDFSKDEIGYYTIKDNQRWYYSSCANDNVAMDEYLRVDGNLTYRLRQFCPITVALKNDIVELKNGLQTSKITIKWTLAEAYLKENYVDYKLYEEKGIAYVSIRSFEPEYDSVLSRYEKDSASIKDAKLIVYDIRSNYGGIDEYARKWVTNLTGENPAYPYKVANWSTYLWKENGGVYNKEEYDVARIAGKIIDNDIPVIILVDDRTGSSGESALLFTQTLKNSIVIGSNSGGFQICGNVHEFTLPKTGIPATFSQCIGFTFESKNVDGMGYEPDIWCNPMHALKAVVNMLENYNLTDSASIKAFSEYVKKNTTD